MEIYAILIIFAADLLGGVLRSVYPWLQQKQADEATLRALQLIPESQLTDEQKAFIKQMEQPLNFRKYYLFSTIVGLIGTLTLTIGSFALLTTQLPENFSIAGALIFAPTAFLSGWGGSSFSNQLLSSKTGGTEATGNKAMVTAILSKAETKSDTASSL